MKRDALLNAAYAVHDLLAEEAVLTRLATKPKIVLQFPDMGTMYHFHMGLLQAMGRDLMLMNGNPETKNGDGIIEIEVMSVTFALVCTQQIQDMDGRAHGYNSTRIISGPPPRRDTGDGS